jgi:phosphohistidine phosphatase
MGQENVLKKKLLLVRHGKAGPGMEDFKRRLSAEGIVDLAHLKHRLPAWASNNPKIVCSPASRTTDTLRHLFFSNGPETHLKSPENLLFCRELYGGGPDDYFFCLSREAGLRDIIFIGHNPGITEFANTLGSFRIDNLPEGCALEFEIPVDGDPEKIKGNGEFVAFYGNKRSVI